MLILLLIYCGPARDNGEAQGWKPEEGGMASHMTHTDDASGDFSQRRFFVLSKTRQYNPRQ